MGRLLHRCRKPPHGNVFFKWAARVETADPTIGEITTRHSYDIFYKFRYQCMNTYVKERLFFSLLLFLVSHNNNDNN